MPHVYQILCSQGHLTEVESSEDVRGTSCECCGAEFIWFNPAYTRSPAYVELEIDVPAKYVIPEGVGCIIEGGQQLPPPMKSFTPPPMSILSDDGNEEEVEEFDEEDVHLYYGEPDVPPLPY